MATGGKLSRSAIHACSIKTLGEGSVLPWLCKEEWEAVYNWLYSSDTGQLKHGVGRVRAWGARGDVPMMVELTADLCECRLKEREKSMGVCDFQSILLHYSMVITR